MSGPTAMRSSLAGSCSGFTFHLLLAMQVDCYYEMSLYPSVANSNQIVAGSVYYAVASGQNYVSIAHVLTRWVVLPHYLSISNDMLERLSRAYLAVLAC